MRVRSLLLAVVISVLPGLGVAADDPAAKAFKEANDLMMADMMSPAMTGDPDVDFAKMMIPHHQGAIAMAKVVLQYGDDPDIRALAEAIVKSQAEEVQWMTDWLVKQPK